MQTAYIEFPSIEKAAQLFKLIAPLDFQPNRLHKKFNIRMSASVLLPPGWGGRPEFTQQILPMGISARIEEADEEGSPSLSIMGSLHCIKY